MKNLIGNSYFKKVANHQRNNDSIYERRAKRLNKVIAEISQVPIESIETHSKAIKSTTGAKTSKRESAHLETEESKHQYLWIKPG